MNSLETLRNCVYFFPLVAMIYYSIAIRLKSKTELRLRGDAVAVGAPDRLIGGGGGSVSALAIFYE